MADGKKPGRIERAKGTADRTKNWVESQDPTTSPGVTVGWFRRYIAADGQIYAVLLTSYLFLTVLPASLVIDSYLDTNPNALSDHVIKRLGLHGATEDLFRSVLPGARGHKLTASLIALASVALFGLGIGRVLQFAHARRGGSISARPRSETRLATSRCCSRSSRRSSSTRSRARLLHGKASWIGWAIAPFWLLGIFYFFVWAPRLLLHKRVPRRDIVPGAVFTLICLLGIRVASHFLLVNWLEWYGKYYGGLGIVMALFFWVTIFATVLILAAALSPALAHRRDLREERAAAG